MKFKVTRIKRVSMRSITVKQLEAIYEKANSDGASRHTDYWDSVIRVVVEAALKCGLNIESISVKAGLTLAALETLDVVFHTKAVHAKLLEEDYNVAASILLGPDATAKPQPGSKPGGRSPR